MSGSPPTDIVGVARLTASPARRARKRRRKGTGVGRRSRHASVSTAAASAYGKASTIGSRQPSVTNEDQIAAGPICATR